MGHILHCLLFVKFLNFIYIHRRNEEVYLLAHTMPFFQHDYSLLLKKEMSLQGHFLLRLSTFTLYLLIIQR